MKNNEPLLPVMEHYYTLQGEGYHQGRPAYFIRLAGCDVGCTWCDVKESWKEEKHPLQSIRFLISEIKKTPAKLVVITGGEPLLHDLSALTQSLKEEGYEINLETSGTHTFTGYFDWICLSPKKFKAPLTEIFTKANELKVVVYNPSDFEWGEKNAGMVAPDCKLYLQPEWGRLERMLDEIVDYIKNNPKWALSLQVHKYIQVP